MATRSSRIWWPKARRRLPAVLEGHHEGAFMGSEPTHQLMAWKGISTYQFEDGKIKERWANQDVLPMLQQMGLIHAIGLS